MVINHQEKTYIIPYELFFYASFAIRGFLHYKNSTLCDINTRHWAAATLTYDLIQFVWSFDITYTFSLVGQPVFKNRKVPTITHAGR